MFSDSLFRNKLALVTGAASGIGHEIATDLLRAGAHVCLLDNDAQKMVQALAGLSWADHRVDSIVQSVGDMTIMDLIAAYPAEHGYTGFDILVNAAAISPKQADGLRDRAWEIAATQWEQVMQINVNGAFHTMSAVLPDMIKHKQGAIVNISSLAARRYSSIAGAAYATSKAALEAMTRQFAGEAAELGVRINAIAPGRIVTPMSAQAGVQFNEQIRMQTPLRRLGTPHDISRLALFLLSDSAGFITGETIVASGGRGL